MVNLYSQVDPVNCKTNKSIITYLYLTPFPIYFFLIHQDSNATLMIFLFHFF